ncbi:hypothetical protein TTHERM_00502090 (macronuclear) [Tetrahymena thermophila SB210]|uniref:Uncharacterized protein n=1 Tax=Tetrahymena thermophila (strain SB210) TaxID=312017 RepID=I7MLF8_TETTS|nr:hypothetical protein TTHERM_00502090 [Tetrahymena thermophila SB210]EAS02018.2 hypothetical protein TTHERM_00502090 [Tetrahymena thermophila SB210]|eukprot:XP_001022263.2 hypothetical protein TTHERM_00502090 [Tetrahymena thermophila SB210]
MGNNQQKVREGERVEIRNKRSFNPNSSKKIRASSALQSHSSAFVQDSAIQSRGTANFGLLPNQFVQSQIVNSYQQQPTFTNNKVVSQSVSPINNINKLNVSNNQIYTPTNQGQDNMLGLTPRTFQRANDASTNNNMANYYNNLTSQIVSTPSNNQTILQSKAIDKSQIHSGANTLVLNKYYNGKNQKNKPNFVVNKYFDGQLIDQNVLNNISQNHLNKTQIKADTSFNTSMSTRKDRLPMSERLLHRRHSDNSIATFQQQIEAFTRRSIRERKKKYKRYENQENFVKAIEFSADYKLCANLFTGSSQTLVQPTLLVYNQDLLQPIDPTQQNQKSPLQSQRALELQIYLQFLNDTENNSISNVDFIQLAKEKKEDEDLKLIQYLREQQKSNTQILKHPSRLNQQVQEKQKKQIQNYFESKSELPNRDFANMIDEQFRKANQQQNGLNANSQIQAQANQITSNQQFNIFDKNSNQLNPSFSQNLNNNSKNLHQIQMQLFQQQSKNIQATMNQQIQENTHNQQIQNGNGFSKNTFYQRQLTLGQQEQGDNNHITEEEWKKLANPLHDNSPKQIQNEEHNFEEQKNQQNLNSDNDDEDDDEKYIKVDFDNQNQHFNNQNSPFAKNIIQNQNGFSNMSSIVMNNSQQSEQIQNSKENVQKQNEDKTKNKKKMQHSKQNSQQSKQLGQNINNSQKNMMQNQQIMNNQENIVQNSSLKSKVQNNIINSQKNKNSNLPEQQQLNNSNPKKIPIKIIGLQIADSDGINSLDQFHEVQSDEIYDHKHQNDHSPRTHSQDNSLLRESQISVVSDEEKMLHFQNQLKMQQQKQNNSTNQVFQNQIEQNQQSSKTTHFLPNFQFNHLPINAKGTIVVDQKNNQSLIQNNLNQQQDFDKKKYQNSYHASPDKDYNSEVNESLYQDVHKLEQEDNIRRLALKKAEEEYDLEIRKKEIEMMLLDKRIEQKKETNFQSHRNKQFRMEELANKHYQELKNQYETNDHVDRMIDQSLNKNQIDGFMKRYQNSTLNTTNPIQKGNQSKLNTFNQSISSNYPSQKKGEVLQNSNDKYKSSYMNTNQYQNQHKKKRNMQVDSFKQTLFQNQNYLQSNQSSAEKKQESVFNSKFYQENEQQLVKNIMNQNIFKKEDQENQQKNVSEYYLQKLKQGQLQREKEKQEQLAYQQKQHQDQQNKLQNQKMARFQSEESQQYNHDGQGIDNLDLFQEFDEAESHHQDEDDENDHEYINEQDKLTENEEEYAEDSDDSMHNYNQENKPIELKMDLNYFKKNRKHTSDFSEEEEEHKSGVKSSQTQNQAEVIPIQLDIKDFIKKKTENNKNNNLDSNFQFAQSVIQSSKDASRIQRTDQRKTGNNLTEAQNLVQSVKENMKKVSNNKLAQTQQLEVKRKDSENSPISARGSIPGFGDRKNSESEGESILKSITQQVIKLKGKIEKDKVNLDQSNIEYQTKIASKVINTLNNSKDGSHYGYTEDLMNNSNLHPSSSNKILNQISSQQNLGSQNEFFQNQKTSKSSTNLKQNQLQSQPLNSPQQQQNPQQQKQTQQFQFQQQQQQQPILININPTTPSASQKSHQSLGNDSKISQRSQLIQQNQMNSNNTSNKQTPRNNSHNQKNIYNQQENMNFHSPNTLGDPNQSIPIQFNKAVSEYDYESQSQFSSFPNEEKMNNKRQNIIKTLYIDQKQYSASPSEQKLGYDAAMAKRQNTLLAINSQVEQSDQSLNNKPQSQFYNNNQQDRRQSTNSQISIRSNANNLPATNAIESQQYIQKIESNNQLPSKISSQKSIDINVKQNNNNQFENLNNFQNNKPNNLDSIDQQQDHDEYFENQPAQFQQFSSPLIDQSIVRKPSFTKPRSSKFTSNLNSEGGNQTSYFFDMPEDTLGKTVENDAFQFDQNHPDMRKQSSGYSYHSNSFYAMNSQKSSVSNKQLQKGGNNSQRASNAGIDFFNFPSQGQTSSHQQIPTSSKQSITEKMSMQSQVEQNQRRSSQQQNFDFFQFPTQNNNNKPQERNSYVFDDNHIKENHENNYFPNRQSDNHAFNNQQNDLDLHQYESNDYVNKANYQPHQYQYNNHEDNQDGGFDFNAFGDHYGDQNYQNNSKQPSNIKIDVNIIKKR